MSNNATVGSVIAVMKKTIKASGSEGGFKAVASRKKRKGGVLEESIDNKKVVAKALGVHSWNSETGNTIESESINMKEECLVEETSVDYDDNGTFTEGDPDQTPKGLYIKTKKVLKKPLGVIDYDMVDTENDVLDDSFFFPPSFPVKLSIQVPVRKFFTLDIDLVVASTPSKFGGIIWTSFTSEKTIIAVVQLANNCGVVVNTDLKHPINNRIYRVIVLKEIPVRTSIEAVLDQDAVGGFMQKAIIELKDQIQADFLVAEWSILIGKDAVHVAQTDVNKQTWDARDEFRALLYTLPMGTNAHDFWDFIGSVSGKTCGIEHSSVSYVWACCTTVCFNFESSLIQTMANTSVIKGVGFQWSRLTTALCSICKTSGHTSLACHIAGVSSSSRSKRAPLLAQDQFRLVKIYEKKSAPVSRSLAFSGKTWASMVDKPLPIVFFGGSAQFGSISYGKPLLTVNGELKNRLKNIESSLVSLIGQIGELAKRLDSFVPAVSQPNPRCQLPMTSPSQNQGENIVIEVGSGDAISDKTAAVFGSTALPEIVKLENMLEGLSALFGFGRWCFFSISFLMSGLVWKIATCNVRGLNNLVKQNDVICWHKDIDNLVSIFMKSKLKEKVCLWLADKFDGVWVFTSGLDSGSLGAGVLIIMNSSLAKHVCKIFEVSGWLLSIKLLFKNKLSVFILGLYAGASSMARFSQAGEINFLIAKAVNKSSFVILGGDFNENGSHKCASFKKCFDLGLINFLRGSFSVKSLTWYNSRGITKTIDYMFVSSNLVGAVIDCGVDDVEEYFNTNHKIFYVSAGSYHMRGIACCLTCLVILVIQIFPVHKVCSIIWWQWAILCCP
ncbi:hypothetical protein G9A89_023926 [Geosiphon pyriformis]|nr:hypothetical protein G9A89_023926 [Geosiphon pyriformis]